LKFHKFLSVLFILFFITICFFLTANTAKEKSDIPSVYFTLNDMRYDCFVQKNTDVIYLYLPNGIIRSDIKIFCEGELISFDDKTIQNGDSVTVTSDDAPISINIDGNTYSFQFLPASEIPSLYITTESGFLYNIHADKNYKESGTLTVIENGSVSQNIIELDYIKGRGHSTWDAGEKKPYNIKLKEKADLFGMGAAKKWALLANSYDPTLLKNAVAYDLAQNSALPYTVEYKHVDLFINGEYRGNYLLCEKVEQGEQRVNINDLDRNNEESNTEVDLQTRTYVYAKADGQILNPPDKFEKYISAGIRKWIDYPVSPENISGGYLLEFTDGEDFLASNSGFITARDIILILKSPENATKEEIEYISSLYQELEDALFSPDGKNAYGKHYSEYIDMASIVDSYLIYDFTQDEDNGQSSWFLFKEKDSELFFGGPVWDFDYSMNSVGQYPEGIIEYYEAINHPQSVRGSVINFCCLHDDFLEIASHRWPTLAEYINQIQIEKITNLRNLILNSAIADALLWNNERTAPFSGDTAQEMKEAYIEVSDQLLSYLPIRAEILSNGLSNRAAILEELARVDEPENANRTDSENTSIRIITASVIALIMVLSAAFAFYYRKER